MVAICEDICFAHCLCKNAQMEWSDLRIFLAAVRAGSYTAAGRQLGINRTTVGRRIEALEAALGVELFLETPRGPAPTRDGELLLAAATGMEREAERLADTLGRRDRASAPVRIASSAGLASEFLDELRRFQETEPSVRVELLGELDPVDAVTYRRADLGIALLRVPPRRLHGVQVAVLAQAPYGRIGRASDRPLGWGHEIDHALPGQWTGANLSGDRAEAAGLPSFNNWPQLKQAVLAGLGTASLWCFAADEQAALERLGEPDARNDYPLWLLHRAKMPPGRGLERLIAFLEEALGARLRSAAQAPR